MSCPNNLRFQYFFKYLKVCRPVCVWCLLGETEGGMEGWRREGESASESERASEREKSEERKGGRERGGKRREREPKRGGKLGG